MSIKQCLQNFFDHVEVLKELDDYGEDGYTKEFQNLKQQSVLYRVEGTYTTQEGEKEYNRRKNRYKDILPFDYTRVMLAETPGIPGSEYINANFIKGVTGHASYIASQGPLPSTICDFWRMVWHYGVHIVIMACNEYEGDKLKCARYWPDVGEEKTYGKTHVLMQHEETQTGQHFVVRRMRVWQGECIRTVYQFHYIGWPDHGIPNVPSLLDLIALVREYQPQHRPPLVVHCSAGCGRTGTICAIDYAWSILKLGRLTEDFSMYDIVQEMRRQRPSIVQAKDQYIAVHQAVQELFKRHLVMIDQHCYENVDSDGKPKIFEGLDNHNYDSLMDSTATSAGEPLGSNHESVSTEDVISVYEEVSPFSRAVMTTVTNLINAKQITPHTDASSISEPCKYADLPLRGTRRNQIRSLSQGCSYDSPNSLDADQDSFLHPNSHFGGSFDENGLGFPPHRSKGVKLKLQNPPMKPRRKAQIKKSASEGDTPSECDTEDMRQETESVHTNMRPKSPSRLAPPELLRTTCLSGDSENDTDEDLTAGTSPVLLSNKGSEILHDSPDSPENPFFDTKYGTQVRPRLVVQRVLDEDAEGTAEDMHNKTPVSPAPVAMETSQTSLFSNDCESAMSTSAMSTSAMSESTHSAMDTSSPTPPPPPIRSTSTTSSESVDSAGSRGHVADSQGSHGSVGGSPCRHATAAEAPRLSVDEGYPSTLRRSSDTSSGSRGPAPEPPSVPASRRPPMPPPKSNSVSDDVRHTCGHYASGSQSSSSDTSTGSGAYSYAYTSSLGSRSCFGTLPVAPPRRKHGRSSSSRSSRCSSGEYEVINSPFESHRRDSRDSIISDNSEDNAYALVAKKGAAPLPPPLRDRVGSADATVVPTKSHMAYMDESNLSQSSDSLETNNKESAMLALGKKLKQKVQQTFGPHNTSTPPVHDNSRPSSVYFKGQDISFPQRLERPRGPKSAVDHTSHNSDRPEQKGN